MLKFKLEGARSPIEIELKDGQYAIENISFSNKLIKKTLNKPTDKQSFFIERWGDAASTIRISGYIYDVPEIVPQTLNAFENVGLPLNRGKFVDILQRTAEKIGETIPNPVVGLPAKKYPIKKIKDQIMLLVNWTGRIRVINEQLMAAGIKYVVVESGNFERTEGNSHQKFVLNFKQDRDVELGL